jgi:arylsulfatase A-like enzyme
MYEGFWKTASPADWKMMTMRYYANITWIDDMMGRTLKALEQQGILDNAIIVYTSDHGEMLGEHYYRFNKYNLYEASVRVPFILAGTALPDSLQLGTISQQAVDLVDIVPTLLSLSDIQVPTNLPGYSLVAGSKRTANFAALHERAGEAAFMWRTPKEKLILVFERQENAKDYQTEHIITGEYYDLVKDPLEWNDLYDSEDVAAQKAAFTAAILDKLNNM